MFVIFTLVFNSCYIEDKCFSFSCTEQFNFQLIDTITRGDLVFGFNPLFKLDSMQLNKAPDFILEMHYHFLGRVSGSPYGLTTSIGEFTVDTSYLRLTYNDIDTLIINFTRAANDCCTSAGGYGKIVSIRYNGKLAQKSGDNYLFEK